MTDLWLLCLMAEIMVTVAVAQVSFVSVKETNAFVPHSYPSSSWEHFKTSKRKVKIYRVYLNKTLYSP